MGNFFAPADFAGAGSAAETCTEACAAMTAGIAAEIDRKVRRDKDGPGEEGFFI